MIWMQLEGGSRDRKIVVITDSTDFFWQCAIRITYDAEADALSIVFAETTVTTQHLADRIAADYDQAGCLAGLKILDVRSRLGGEDTFRRIIVEGIGGMVPAQSISASDS